MALIVAGCGFSPSVQHDTQGADAPPADGSGSVSVPMDAPPKMVMDAPPCADDDQDGICNTVDEWPCGATPGEIATSHDLYENGTVTHFALSMISFNDQGTLAVVGHNTQIRIAMHWTAVDNACNECTDQLEVGFHPTGHRAGCILDRGIPSGTTQVGDISTTAIRAPNAPGLYEVRMHIGQNFSCNSNGATDWYGGNEPQDVIAKLCVQ